MNSVYIKIAFLYTKYTILLLLVATVDAVFLLQRASMSEKRPLEDLLKDTPQEKLDWLVSTSDITQVARRLSKWPLLAPYLHIEQQQVKEIESSYPSDLQRQKLNFLQKWSHDQYFKATYRALIQALYNVENLDLIDEICKLLKTKSCPSPPPQTILWQYAQELRVSYNDLMPPPIFQALAGDDEEGPSPSEKFINLVMTSRERVQRGGVDDQHMRMALEGNVPGMADYMSEKKLKVPVELRNIFTLDSKKRKVILIEGAPGSGKTTLFWHICQRWSAGELFSQFNLVLLVRLRDPEVQKAKGVADILPFADKQEEIAIEIKLRKGNGILFLFDGWDELPREQQRNSLFQTLIEAPRKHSLQQAAVVVSARQVSSASLQHYISTRIEILGFTPDQIEEYVKTSLESQPQEASSLITTIRQDPILQGNCYLPLSIATITHIFICMGHTLPATFCRIIEELALSCLYRYIKKHSPYGHLYRTLNSFDDLQADMQIQFNTMCEKAYNSLLRSQYSFSGPDIPTLGLMQSVQSFVVRGKSTQHYFLHMSLHELCAAKYLVTLPEEHQSSILDDVLKGKVTQMTNMLSFYSALGGWMSAKPKQLFTEHVQNIFYTECRDHAMSERMISNDTMRERIGTEKWVQANPLLTMIYSVYESQKPELCHLLPTSLGIIGLPLTIRDCIALRYIISQRTLERLNVQLCPFQVGCDFLRIIAPALKCNIPQCLILCALDVQSEEVSVLADAIIGTSLKDLLVVGCGITAKSAKVLSSALCGSRIKRFCLSMNRIGDAGLRYIASNLTRMEVEYLGLDLCGIGDEGVITLSRALPTTKITGLSLSQNHISARGFKALGEGIMKTPHFVTLFIWNPSTVTAGIKELLVAVANHPKFETLVISEKDINEIKDTIIDVYQERKKLGLEMIFVTSTYELVKHRLM